MRILLGLILVAAVLYVVAGGLLYSQQRRFLFPAPADRADAAKSGLAEVQDIVIGTSDGERLVAWWRPPQPGKALVLFFHGNGGSLWNRRDRARALIADGRGLLMVSYRGYSGSTGSPTEAGLRLDGEAAYRYLAPYDPNRIVLYGESLGTGVAIGVAARHPVGALVLDAPYTSIADVARPLFRIFPVDRLLRDSFRSIDQIGAVRAPILVLHGERDGLIPIALAERLFAAAPEPKRFVRLPAADHVNVLEAGGLAPVRHLLEEVEARLAASAQTADGTP